MDLLSLSWRRSIPALAGLLMLLAPLAGRAEGPPPRIPANGALAYTILKDGEPIGDETLSFHRDGAITTVTVRTDTLVKILFLDFHYHHQRDETWTGDRLTRLVADTDDDGTRHHVEAQAGAAGLEGRVDGRALSLPADAMPLTLWGGAVLSHPVLYDIVDAAPYRVHVADLGPETLTANGRSVTARHYRLRGDIERDLWYGPDGLLERVDFSSHGFPITVLRRTP